MVLPESQNAEKPPIVVAAAIDTIRRIDQGSGFEEATERTVLVRGRTAPPLRLRTEESAMSEERVFSF
jgi:hypothetical protein